MMSSCSTVRRAPARPVFERQVAPRARRVASSEQDGRRVWRCAHHGV